MRPRHPEDPPSFKSLPCCLLFSTEKLPVGLRTLPGLVCPSTCMASNGSLGSLWTLALGSLLADGTPGESRKGVAVWLREDINRWSKLNFSFLTVCLSPSPPHFIVRLLGFTSISTKYLWRSSRMEWCFSLKRVWTMMYLLSCVFWFLSFFKIYKV